MITEIMEKDLLGPLTEDEIICDERPLDYYIVGKLYPRQSDADSLSQSSADDCGALDEEDNISLCNGYNPSSFSVSVSLNPKIESFTVKTKAACYTLIERDKAREILKFDDKKYKKNAYFWRRQPLQIADINIIVGDLVKGKNKTVNIARELDLSILFHKEYSDGSKTITISIVNRSKIDASTRESYITECVNSYFQPEIRILPDEAFSFGDIRKKRHLNSDPEIAEMNMLYSNVKNYASGHGCAVFWETIENGDVEYIKSEFLPKYDLRQMMSTEKYNGHSILEMKRLSEDKPVNIMEDLKMIMSDYSSWISEQRKRGFDLSGVAPKTVTNNLDKCENILHSLRKSISLLSDNTVFRAFSYANLAMFMQRQRKLKNEKKYESDEKITWYPFQLAFFLKEIYSIVYPESPERNETDLLWFPTGGGKTEAYLGIAAFTIFYRRLKYGEKSDGVTVLMRYTLRLLSFQQFERASSLICACEIIRKKNNIPGGEIGIGLWAGQALTPNTIEKADKILKGELEPNEENGNPVQIEKCPWCGSPISKSDYSCDLTTKRMIIRCPNTECDYKAGLPIYLIDEEIYISVPAYIIGTIDKFAQLALNERTGNLFGIGLNKRPPELIIQDELHLISGPLGTITGIYEAAIRKLCEFNGYYPKIIASTATIRNAKDQIKNLYSTSYTQFPPQGININDSFFAQLSTSDKRPARMYLGCMGIGTSPITMMIRVMASLLFSSRYLTETVSDDSVIDSFWTITTYFNTLRELGGAIIRVVDDIQDRFEYLKNSKFAELYPLKKGTDRYDNYKELTSREKSENIGRIIQTDLLQSYKSDGSTRPFDFLLCSNMISVGVDVGRLGTMIVVGQPKTSSEYIQATSRVGRETPGLVIATYNQAKSRDRSHFENFTQYHSSFYKYVESTSVTPFSVRARDRALQALYVILCRYLIPSLRDDNSAVNFNRGIKELNIVREYIKTYVSDVDPDELNDVLEDLKRIELEWEEKAEARNHTLKYKRTKYSKASETLFDPDYNENSRFRVLNSMRSVETMIDVIVKEE
jgi:uncharacterized protein YktA (UPF0223 family)